MAICREAFGGYFYQWTVEEQYWFEEMMVQIGHIDRIGHCLPGAGDMTVEEARARAAGLLNAEYQAELPVASDDMWEIDDYFGREAGDEACERPPVWSFTYVDRVTGIDRYFITMTQSGDVMDMQAAGVTSYREASSISQVMDLMETQYGSLTEWPIELWAEFGEVIRDMRPATANEWAFQHAGYCLPKWTEDVPLGDARLKAIEAVGLPYTTWFTTTFCKDGERTIWRVVTHTKEPGHEMSAKYDAIWVVELDSRTGEVLRKEEYVYGKSLMRMMYVPFSVAERTPTFENGVNQTEYAQAQAEYGENWFFWPLTVQARVKGAPHSVPAPGEMTREQAVQKALDAVIAEKGQAAVDALGTYQVGVILARYLETDGLVRTYWEVYFTTDPVGLSDGWRVTFAGENAETEEVWITEASNWGNG